MMSAQEIYLEKGTAYIGAQVADIIRARLKQSVRSAWATPEGVQLSNALRAAAVNSGYADAVKSIMESVAPSLRNAARQAGLSERYKVAWGKR